jgi:hypothetical protein
VLPQAAAIPEPSTTSLAIAATISAILAASTRWLNRTEGVAVFTFFGGSPIAADAQRHSNSEMPAGSSDRIASRSRRRWLMAQ